MINNKVVNNLIINNLIIYSKILNNKMINQIFNKVFCWVSRKILNNNRVYYWIWATTWLNAVIKSITSTQMRKSIEVWRKDKININNKKNNTKNN